MGIFQHHTIIFCHKKPEHKRIYPFLQSLNKTSKNIKNSPQQRIREHSREHMTKEHMMKYYNISEKQLQNWLQEYQRFDISADGNTSSFKESVIAGTGASNGASNGSVNYSAGNPILWSINSTDPIGGFYSNGSKICWRAYPLTEGSVPP
ncbi:MAG: hypothetical protein EZS28_025997 [Streblomastix strix]|uniref:Uncharacterized protein n=1 Tax=Streblomastix strix TaxID=222440 RepID=A0A5J4V6I0_9EUKA|nr:MAG: hypothetical protein EZS28_025997 [Streblomastix strix]